MAGERIKALAGAVAEAIAGAEGLVVKLDEVLEDIDDAVEQRVEALKSGLARLHERFTALQAALDDEDGGGAHRGAMIDPTAFLELVIDPGCKLCSMSMRRDMGTDEARVLLLAIALQESGLEHRRQVGDDGQPMDTLARGWWQFERNGGVAGVCTHPASEATAEAVCGLLRVPFTLVEADGDEYVHTDTIHEALAWSDPLASAFARLLLWTDPRPLPDIGDEGYAWDYYLDLWRPGKPHPECWPANYTLAVATVGAAPSAESDVMPKPDEKPDKPHPVHEDHPGKGRGDNPNPGNQPYPPGQKPEPNQDLPESEPPQPEQLPS